MRIHHHSRSHWFAVALIAAIALFTFGHVWGASPALAPIDVVVEKRKTVKPVPKRDKVARDATSPTRKAKRGVKRSIERSRTGVGGIDS